MNRDEAWKVLSESAKAYAGNPDKHMGTALSKAAKDWAQVNGFAPVVGGTGRPASSGGPTIPFGRSKGTPVSAAETSDLQWVASALERSINDPEKAKWVDGNRSLLAAIDAELTTRGSPRADAPGEPF